MMNRLQQEAFDAVREGRSILLTGPAGTGKTYVLQQIIMWARDACKDVGITASTGLAAYMLRGRTIHSFLGIGLGAKSATALADKVMKIKGVYNRLRGLEVLLIDEVSMIEGEFLEKISDFLSILRGDTRPFGGIQVVLCGDFCQLPPVNGEYCFTSGFWKTAGIETVMLEELVRQDKDTEFQKMLGELRWGVCTKDTLKRLKGLKDTRFEGGVVPTRLYSVNVDVDKINAYEYKKMVDKGAATRVYKSKFTTHPSTEQWCKSVKIPEEVELCVGAQVLVTWNLPTDLTIVNGTRGVVTEVGESGPKIRLVSGREVKIEPMKIACEDNDKIAAMFVPLRLAYALSIHKSQGMTLDAVEIDLGESIFEYGQAYVALSRARSLDSVRVVEVKSRSFRTHPKVKEFYGYTPPSPPAEGK